MTKQRDINDVPPKIGFGRRNFFRDGRTLPKRLLPSVRVSQNNTEFHADSEYAQLKKRVLDMERAHDDRNAEAEALRKIGESMGSLFDLEEMLQAVAGVAVQVTSTDSSQVYLLNDSKDTLVLRAIAPNDSSDEVVGKLRLKVGEGLTGWVAQHKDAVALGHDAHHDPRFKFVPELLEDKYQSILSVPLLYRGDVIGVINVRTAKAHVYTQTQVRLVQSIASQVAGAVENSRQYRKMERRSSQLSTLSEVSKTITSDLYLEEILQLIVAATAETLAFKICTLMLVDEDREELVVKATHGNSREFIKKNNLKIGESMVGQAIADGIPKTIYDLKSADRSLIPELARVEGLSSMVALPLLVKNKRIGVLSCYTEKAHRFTDDELSVLTALGNHAAIAIEHAKLMVRSAIIQEMHHRVKNNLQQVASLLRLQMHYAGQRSVAEVLSESLNRILAIASVHELLSREDLDIISVKKVAESIVAATSQSVIAPDRLIAMTIEGPDILLPSAQATSVALILNELTQNAVEHGFANGTRDGHIMIGLHEEPHSVQLSVTNDGIPLPADFDVTKLNSLGLQIVDSLVRGDLQGKFTLQSSGGMTSAVVDFAK